MRLGRFSSVALVTPVLAIALLAGCSSPSGPSQVIPDFPNSAGSWWTYEVSTTKIVSSDTTRSRDTITARITAEVLLNDGETAASVWKFDPYFIDIDESKPESLLVSSLGLNTRTDGDTIRIYDDASPASLRHTIYLKESPPPRGWVVTAFAADCRLSRPIAIQTRESEDRRPEQSFWVSTFCLGGTTIVIGPIPAGDGLRINQRSMKFQPHVGFVEIHQQFEDSDSTATNRTWTLLAHHVVAPEQFD